MVKNISRRFLATLMALLLIVTLIPNVALAANVNTGVTGLTADSSGSATWDSSGGTITGSVVASSSSGCTGTTYTAQTGTLTFTNSSGGAALLSFDYSLELAGGSATIDGATVEGGSFSKKLEADDTVAVAITSPKGERTTSITISNLKLTEEKPVDVTFKAPANGSYTVDGAAVTSETTKTVLTTDSVALVATAVSGYKFFGWYSETTGSYISLDASAHLSFTESMTVEPKFITSSTPIFQVGSMLYTDLNAAVGFAQTSGIAKITLIGNGTLPAGDYTIPRGKTLLIPFDAAQTVFTTTPEVVYNTYETPSAYRTLTMAKNAKITVASGGAISVGSKLSSKGQLAGYNGTPTGPDGRINMASGSSITVQNGGNLYAWGYIYGSGAVTAESGATVYEAFQIKDWRGGSATSNVYDYAFILNQYYVQNIEVPLTLYAGATEKLYSSVNASGSAYTMGATFVGSGGMFNITSGYIVKDYIESTDRLQVDAYGTVSVTPMSLTGLPIIGSISTEEYILPINGNITINIHSGVTANITQDIELLPSAEINVDSGATLGVADGKRVYVYDNDDWGNFTGSARLYVIGYSVANGTKAIRTAAKLTDAKILVNGTVTVNGSIYTSAGGAAIVSDGTGVMDFKTAPPASSTIYEMANNSTKTAVDFTAAKLQNGDGSYVPTAGKSAGAIPYENGWWGGSATATFQNYDGTELASVTVGKGMTPEVPAAAQNPTRPATDEFTYTFSGWEPAIGAITEDTTYVAQFTEAKRSYTVTFYDEDGSTVLDTQTVEYGVTPVFSKDEPTKAADAQYTYTFSGWEPALSPVTGDASYKATYSEAVNNYTVIWQNEDGTELEKDENVPYGTTPTYDGAEPVKASDAQYDYSFAGWNKEVEPVTGDVTYTATFSQTTREYTITWAVNGETSTSTVKYGEVPVYAGADPAMESTAEFDYNFTGWSPEPVAVTGEATYTAQFEAVKRSYTIRWLDANGVESDTTTVEYGVVPTHDPIVADNTDAHTYTFIGWDPEPAAVTGEATYRAVVQEDIRTYTITWLNEDGTVFDSTIEPYGTVPSHDGPTKAETMLETYAFAGWSPEISSVTGEATYSATFTTTVKSGWIEWEGAQYYIAEGEPVKGVYEIDGEFYIFDTETGAFRSDANGPTDVGEDTYLAENGKVVKNPGLVRIEETEEYFYFGEDNKALKNQRTWIDNTNELLPVWAYTFTETGAIEHADVTWEGLQSDGYTYIDGIRVYLGLVQEADGSYHYYTSKGEHIVGRSYWISKTNPETVKDPNGNPFPEASYEFDAQGRMILPDSPDAKNGIIPEDGSLYYYKDNVRNYAGLIKIDGDYYYVRYGGEVVHGTDYWVTKNNDIMPSARYNFADDGKMILTQPKNGIVPEDGSLYYYKDGARNYAGLIKIDGDYYYVRQTGEVVHGTDYWVTKNNDIVPSARYTFADDGKMVLTGTPLDPGTEPQPDVKNGIYEEDGVKYYYENGAKKYAGVIVAEDPENPGSYVYFYVNSSCQVKTSGAEGTFVKYTASLTNGLIPVARYQFDSLGRMYDLQGNLLTAAAP